MEAAFAHDFSGVRVHTGPDAAESAARLNANAYTYGNHVVFAAGRYSPDTREGARLLAHELTHTIQQNSGALMREASAPSIQDDPALEAQADSVGETVASGGRVNQVLPLGSSVLPVARDEPGSEAKTPDPKREVKTALGSPLWPWKPFEHLILKLPGRWREAIKRAEATKKSALFDIDKSRKLVYEQVQSLLNIFYGGVFTEMSKNKPDVSKGVEMAESMSGVADSYLNLVSLALKIDLKKYLENELVDAVQENLLWAILYGLVIQGGIVGMTAALEKDLDFTTIIKPALKKFTEIPAGLSRPLVLGNTPDKRWSAYPFWPETARTAGESGVSAGLTGMDPSAPSYTLSSALGLNIPAIAGMYPESDEEKKKYSGLELYPYGFFTHSWAKGGQPEPAGDRWSYLAGLYGGYRGIYGLVEGGQRFGATDETYLRQALTLRFPPRALFQVSGEESKRGEADWAMRLNASARLNLIDAERWKLGIGAGFGGVVTGGGAGGTVKPDISGQVSLGYLTKPSWSTEALRTGFDISATSRPADPFSAAKGSLFSAKGSISILDFLRVSVEYHQYTGEQIELNLPRSDVRFMISPGPGLFYFK